MEKYVVKERIETILDMSDEEFKINLVYIRDTLEGMNGLIHRYEQRMTQYEKLKKKVKMQNKGKTKKLNKLPTEEELNILIKSLISDEDLENCEVSFNTYNNKVHQVHFEFKVRTDNVGQVRETLKLGINKLYHSIDVTYNY